VIEIGKNDKQHSAFKREKASRTIGERKTEVWDKEKRGDLWG